MDKKTLIVMGAFVLLLGINWWLWDRTYSPHRNPTALRAMEIYSGKLPCADCDAIQADLQLSHVQGEASGNFILQTIYLGQSGDTFETTGEWTTEKNAEAEIVILNPGHSTDAMLFKRDTAGGLVMLGKDRQPIPGSDNYTLTKMAEGKQ